MSKRNGKPRIHLNQLQLSTRDDVALGQAVEDRYLELCRLWPAMRGMAFVPPASLDKDMVLWRTMRVRHKAKDFRNTRSELLATRTIAQWTLDKNMELRNQPAKKLEWRD